MYKLVASGPSGTAEKELQLIVVPEGGGEEETAAEVDLTPIPVDEFGAYVTEQHANGNKKFSNNYTVGLIHSIRLLIIVLYLFPTPTHCLVIIFTPLHTHHTHTHTTHYTGSWWQGR